MTEERHVRHNHIDHVNKAWCGKTVYSFEWVFMDVDHVVYSIQKGNRVIPCRKCIQAISEILQKEIEGEGESEEAAVPRTNVFCYHCGSTDLVVDDNECRGYRVMCEDCSSCGPLEETEQDAWDAYQQRAQGPKDIVGDWSWASGMVDGFDVVTNPLHIVPSDTPEIMGRWPDVSHDGTPIYPPGWNRDPMLDRVQITDDFSMNGYDYSALALRFIEGLDPFGKYTLGITSYQDYLHGGRPRIKIKTKVGESPILIFNENNEWEVDENQEESE